MKRLPKRCVVVGWSVFFVLCAALFVLWLPTSPLPELLSSTRGSAWALALGLLLAGGTSLGVHRLTRRLDSLQRAHQHACMQTSQCQHAQAAIRVSEERYRTVFSQATEGLMVVDEGLRIVQANPAACLMHGYRPGDLDGTSLAPLVQAESLETYEAFLIDAGSEGAVRSDVVHQRRDATTLEVELRGSRYCVGDTVHMVAILTDVTERNRAVKRLGLLSRKALMAQEDERARVSRDLHDELGQLLMASRLELGMLQKHVPTMSDGASQALARAVEAVEKSADELRRICRGLRPPILDDLGLEPAVRSLAGEFRERTNLELDLELLMDDGVTISREVSLCTYRVLQESLNNVSRHAEARRVDVTLATSEGELVLSVFDDGRGFKFDDKAPMNGVGIEGMRERATLVAGTIEIRSTPGQGTRVVLRIPLVSEVRERT